MKIARRALNDIVAHAQEVAPEECCGVLLGVGDRIITAVRSRNADGEPMRRYAIDPRDHIAARRQARAGHQEVIGFYHSHPNSAPRPSASDVAEWSYPDALSLIVGVDGAALGARAFRIRSDAVEEVELETECD
jgi:proteasome lid subunit RPN8/RPN11